MIQATSFIDGQLNHLFGTRRQTDLTENDTVAATNNKFDGTANLIQFYAEICKDFSSNTFALSDQAEQEVFCTDVIVLEALRFLLSKAQDFPGSLCKFIKPISVVHLFVTPLSLAEGGTEPSVSLR
jgi:hypothetical protein